MPTSSTAPALRLLPLLIVLAPLLAGCAGAALGAASGFPGIASDGETVYLASGPAVYAIDLNSGAERWHYPLESQRDLTFFAAPAIGAGDQLIVGDFNNQLHALDRRTGNLIWGPTPLSQNGANKEHVIGGPVVTDELVLVPSSDGRLYARRTSDGSAVWAFPPEDEEPLREALWASPTVEGDRVYFGSLDHHLYALDLTSGRPLWPESVDLSGALADAPTSTGELLLIGTFSNRLVALDAAHGEVTWSFASGDWVWGSPSIWEGRAYFGDLSGTLYAVELDSGSEIWRVPTAGGIAASPAVADGRVYAVTETGSLLAWDATDSAPAWRTSLEGQLLTDPLVVGETVLVASTGGTVQLSAYDRDSGAIRWTFPQGEG